MGRKQRESSYLELALRIYIRLAIIFLSVYVIYIIYDDYMLIEKISSLSDLGMFLLFQSLYLIAIMLGFTFYYLIITVLVIAGVNAFKGQER
jgi:hypothetical protein